MINVSELVVDPDFAQPYTYIRRKITWENGRKTTTETTYSSTGVIIASELKNMDLIPQGVTTSGQITLWTHTQLLVTSSDNGEDYLSDIVLYKGVRYIVHNDRNLNEYGYNRYSCTVEPAE